MSHKILSGLLRAEIDPVREVIFTRLLDEIYPMSLVCDHKHAQDQPSVKDVAVFLLRSAFPLLSSPRTDFARRLLRRMIISVHPQGILFEAFVETPSLISKGLIFQGELNVQALEICYDFLRLIDKCSKDQHISVPSAVYRSCTDVLTMWAKNWTGKEQVVVNKQLPSLSIAGSIAKILLHCNEICDAVMNESAGLPRVLFKSMLATYVRPIDTILCGYAEDIAKLLKSKWSAAESKFTMALTVVRLQRCSFQTPPLAAAPFLQQLSLPAVQNCVGMISSLQGDDKGTNALLGVIRWLWWPNQSRPSEISWQVKLVEHFVAAKRFQILTNVSFIVSMPLMELILSKANCRFNAITLLYLLQIGNQESPRAFHSILSIAPKVIRSLREELSNNENHPVDRKRRLALNLLSRLMYQLMYIHSSTDYDSMYSDLRDVIEGLPVPSQSDLEKLKERSWVSSTAKSPVAPTSLISLQNLKMSTNLRGLANLGNTCYLNSILQALYSVDAFRKRVLSDPLAASSSYLKELHEVFAFLKFSKETVVAKNFVDTCRPPWFVSGDQQDSAEFLLYTLDQLESEYKRLIQSKEPNNDLPLPTSIFTGQSDTISTCSKCGKSSRRSEELNLISLAFEDETTSYDVMSMLTSYLKKEPLSGDEKYECEDCGKQDGSRQVQFRNLPHCLMFSLMRFAYDKKTSDRRKITTPVNIPPIISVPVVAECGDILSHEYALHAVVIHCGKSINSGHYYTFAKTSGSSWSRFNDSFVSEHGSLDQILKMTSQYKDDTPYLLFYQKLGHDEVLKGEAILTTSLAQKIAKSDIIEASKKRKTTSMPVNRPTFIRKPNDDEPPPSPSAPNHMPSYVS